VNERKLLGDKFYMTTLYFVRHAHSTYTPDELGRPLSQKGFTDAARVTDLLKTERIDVIISSPFKRAVQTVQGVSDYFDKKVELLEGLKERTLTTSPAKDFNSAINKVWQDPNFSWEGGESNSVAQKRGVDTLIPILEKYKGKNIVIGTHGNIMVLMMNYFNTKYDFDFWKSLDMPDIYKLTFEGRELEDVKRLWARS
jgi:2,3-bisphosphoglycerate-dependent phosphoglycerate mutase